MTLFEYINKYGNYSFKEKEINEVDKVIFSFLSYVNLEKVKMNKKMTISEINKIVEYKYNKAKKEIIAEKDAKKILKAISKKNRYKDCYLFNYIYEASDEYQFSAVTIEYLENNIYISFEGTDEKISSWYEDFLLSYQTATKSHLKAIKYLRKYTLSKYKIIVGGHSKGGNIALVASMNSNFIVKSKIKEIYSIDGPGVLPEVLESKRYKQVEDRYYHIIPENSLIGVILESTKNIVVKTNMSGILAHDIIYWDIKSTTITRSKMTYFTKTLKYDLNKYIYSLTKEELQLVMKDFGKVCKNSGMKSIVEITNSNNLTKLLKEISKTNDKSKKLLLKLLEIFIKSLNKSITIALSERISKLKEKILG